MKTVHNLIILDASGSMQSIYNQALSGLNETIQSIKMAQEENPEMHQVVTLASFSSGPGYLREIFRNTPVCEVRELTREDYRPSGCTALYDAIGEMTYKVKGFGDEDTRYLVTIITDGYENSSHRFTGKQIKSLVDELRQSNWLITYIGANQDVEAVASEMGIRSSMMFDADEQGTKQMFKKSISAQRKFYDALKEDFCCMSADMESTIFDED